MKQQQTIKSLFDDSIKYDEPFTAHYIYFAKMKRKIAFQDTVDKLYELTLTEEETKEFEQLRASDPLKMRPLNLYAIKRSLDCYAFYFAQNAIQARELHYETHGEWANKMSSCYIQMIDKSIYDPDTKQTKSFRDLMREVVDFPCFVAEVEGEKYISYMLWQEVMKLNDDISSRRI